MARIFISYRRTDTQQAAGRLRDALVRHFGKAQIFRDRNNIQAGRDWTKQVREALGGDTIVLALIGSRWVTETDEGGRVIDRADKANRVELETALSQNLTTIPVLVDETTIPRADELPRSLQPLVDLHALTLRDRDWESDVRALISALEAAGVAPASAVVRVRQWLVQPMVLLAIAVVAIAIGVANVFDRGQPNTAVPSSPAGNAPPPLDINEDAVNVQIVFDRSDVMNERFGDGTKLDKARAAVADVLGLLADADNFAWREFGGACQGATATPFELAFARGKDRLERRVKDLTSTTGQSTLVSAVVQATGSFNRVQASKPRASRIVVITGGYDQCGHADPAAAITERLKSYPGVTLDLRFIGVGLTPEAQSRLGALAQASGATFTNARDPAQLETILQNVLLIEPKLADVQSVILVLNQSSEHVNTAIDRITKQQDYDGADRALRQAVDVFERTVIPLPESWQPVAVRELIRIAGEGRNEQQKMLDATKALITSSRSADESGVNAARAAYNAASGAFNVRTGRIEALQQKILQGTP